MDDMGEKPGRSILPILLYTLLLIAGVVAGTLFARASGGEIFLAGEEGEEIQEPEVVGALPTAKPTFTPAPSPTPMATITPPPFELTPQAANPGGQLGSGTPVPESVLFRVHSDHVYLYEGPGSAYPAVAFARRDAMLPVAGRTADGLWWQVCCLEGDQYVWMLLDGSTLLAQGDVSNVPILDVVVYNAPPTPDAPEPIGMGVPVAASDAPPRGRRQPPEPTRPPPSPTPPPGDPKCAIAGATYDSIPVIGEARTRPAASDPDTNLTIRGYEPYNGGFRQLIGLGGETDPHAPQLNHLFEDERINNDLPAVFRVYDWDWNCNCRGPLLTDPEVTAISIPSRPGEKIRVPDRTQGDIGGGYRVMVLYATPNSITLKYTREDNMIYGYGIHIEGVCVDPNLLALYQKHDAAGRQMLPALRGRQPFGIAIRSELRVAVRDTGQFMDPRSKKDWWMAAP